MKQNLLKQLFIFSIIVSSYELKAINNSIAFVYGPGSNCEYYFRDTTGTRTFTPTTYFWDFGDGNSSTQQHAIHTYSSNATYTIKHIISNGSQSDTAIFNYYVYCKGNLPLKADFDFHTNDTVSTTEVFFTDKSDGTPTSWYWNFGDGTYSLDPNPIHIYNSSITQTYNVCLVVSDSADSDTICKNVLVKSFDPCAVFNTYFYAIRDTNCMDMIFVNNSHYTASNFYWDFGDGNTSTSKSPIHTYNSVGYYNVKLYASSSNCADSLTQEIRVTCRTCFSVTADIDLQIDSSNPSKAVLYNNSYGPIGSHFWDFGDGDTSTLAAPMHVYTAPGNIQVTYIVRDTANCYDTAYLYFQIDSNGHIKRGAIEFTLQVIDRTNGQTSIRQVTNEKRLLSIYPQPALNVLFLKFGENYTGEIRIYSIHGTLIQHIDAVQSEILEIDVSNLNSGLYLIQTEDGQINKFLKE